MDSLNNVLMKRQNPFAPPPGVTPNYINPNSIGNEIIVESLILIPLAMVFVVLRIFVKLRIVKRHGWDDYLILIALVLAIARAIVEIIAVKRFHVGVHTWDLAPESFVTVIETQRNLFVVDDLLYFPGMMCVKLSILCYLLLVFRVNQVFRYSCWIMMGFVVSYSTVYFLANILECIPLAKTFHPLTFTGHARCLNIALLLKVNGGFNIASDFMLLVLPLPVISRLQMSLKSKIGVLGIFSTAIFVCITSIIRTVVVFQSLKNIDPSREVVPEAIWLTAEVNVGIICACLPGLGPLWRQQTLHHLIPESWLSHFRTYSHTRGVSNKPTTNAPNTPVGRNEFTNIQSDSALELV